MKKVLIFGGSEFIGVNLISRFSKLGTKITVIADKDSNLWRLANFMFSVDIKRIDFQDYETIFSLVKSIKPDIVINTSAYGISVNDKSIEKIYTNNFIGPKNLLDSILKVGCEIMISIGTSQEYGNASGLISEQTPLRPINDYGLSKALFSLIALKESYAKELPIYYVRAFDVYGPYTSKTRLIGSVLYSYAKNLPVIIDGPMQACYDFLYVEDLVDLVMLILQRKPTSNKLFNAGGGACFTSAQVFQKLKNIIGSSLKIKALEGVDGNLDQPHLKTYSDSSLAKQILGWKILFDIDTGFQAMVKWFDANVFLYDQTEEYYKIGELVSASL